MEDNSEKAKLITQFRNLWEIKGSKPNREEAQEAGISDRRVRVCFGGWSTLGDLATPQAFALPQDGKLIAARYKALARSEKRKNVLEAHEEQDYLQELTASLQKLKLNPIQLNKKEIRSYLDKISKPTSVDRELIGVFSDMHYGLTIDKEEVNDKNSYGWTEACRRTAYMIQEIASYKMEHRKNTKKLHMAYLGDLINGVIHNLSGTDNDLLVHQECGLFHIVYHSLTYLLNFFEEIEVYALPGNHDRRFHRENGGRVSSQKFDSHINTIFFALSATFKDRIKFNIPKSQNVMIDTIGGRICCAHGDTNFSALKNPGSSINTKTLTHQIESFNQGELRTGNPDIKAVIFGHVHQELQSRTMNGIDVLVNCCLSGLDPFAASLTINSSLPSQTIIESSKNFAMGDTRRVRFNTKIDQDKELDKIIPIYKHEIVFRNSK